MLRLIFLCVISLTEFILAENVIVRCGQLKPGGCCSYGKEYETGEFVQGLPDYTGSCQTLVCIFGRLIQVDSYICTQRQQKEKNRISLNKLIQRRFMTTIPPHFTTHDFTTTTPSNMCHYNGKWYMPGTVIGKGQSGDWCYSTHCDHNGQVQHYDNFNCLTTLPTTIPPEFTTRDFTTTTPSNMCHYNGKWYMPGTVIEKGQSGDWCYSTHCDQYGQVQNYDNFNCLTTMPTTIPPTTTTPTTTTPTTTTTRATTTTTEFFITPMYCFFNDPTTGETVVWRGGTEGKLSDGTHCRCEYWGRLSCPENNVG